MIFAGIGIVVLVISFVIALVTLIREQNAIDSTSVTEPLVDKHTNAISGGEEAQLDPLLAHRADEGLSSQEEEALGVSSVHMTAHAPLQDASGGLGRMVTPGIVEEKPHVWWEQLDENGNSLNEKNEDEKSIEKIRGELAKLMSTKTNLKEEEGLTVESHQTQTQSGLGSAALPVEFSLREIKKKD